MRLLIYLLAMMTGFSAAEAARPVSATQASVAQGAVMVVSAASVEQDVQFSPLQEAPLPTVIVTGSARQAISVASTSPVLRHDLTHQ